AKYAGADGALLWEQRYHGPVRSYALATGAAVDASGDVVVTGYSYNPNYNSNGTPDYYTIKYAGADGAVLWEQRYNGPGNGDDRASAMVVDGEGNIYVTGTSQGGYATVKYDANGNQVWIARYDSGYGDGYARSIALDGAGNVCVTGASHGDFATIKYVQTAVAGFPTISTEPQNQNVVAGSNATFAVTAAGNPPLSYQWRFNGTNIMGATNGTLVVTNARDAQAGEYSVQVSNSVGFTVSPLTRLTIVLSVLSAPQSVNGFNGGNATFSVVAGGTGPFSYQWL